MTSRKDFLAATSLFALTPALAEAAAAPSPKPSGSAEPKLTFEFDRARFDEILSKQAKHKQCFGATKLANGGVLEGMNNSIEAYETFLKEGPGALQAVAVLYHGASIGLAMTSSVWNAYLAPALAHAPESIRTDVGSLKRGAGNPYLRTAGKNADEPSVESLVAKGVSFLVCHNAIVGFSYMAAEALKMPVQKVHAAIMDGIVPGALVVPAGVMAINACQEAKFTYISAS